MFQTQLTLTKWLFQLFSDSWYFSWKKEMLFFLALYFFGWIAKIKQLPAKKKTIDVQ